MIITIANWCHKIGKSTISVFYSDYLLQNNIIENAFLIDATDDNFIYDLFVSEKNKIEKNVYVDFVNDDNINLLQNENILFELSESNNIYIVDLKSNFDKNYFQLIKYSNFILVPFANYEDVLNSTYKFSEFLNDKLIDDFTKLLFIENFSLENNFKQFETREELNSFGEILDEKICMYENLKLSFLPVQNDTIAFKDCFSEITQIIFK